MFWLDFFEMYYKCSATQIMKQTLKQFLKSTLKLKRVKIVKRNEIFTGPDFFETNSI